MAHLLWRPSGAILLYVLLRLGALTQQGALAQQAPVRDAWAAKAKAFNITAAWDEAVRAGPAEALPLTGVSDPAGGLALVASNISLRNATIYIVEVPAGNWSLVGAITVQPGQVLVLQGQGALLARPSTPVPASVWVMDPNNSTSDSNITLLPGAAVYLRNLTLVTPNLGPVGTPTAFVPSPIVFPQDQPEAAGFILEFSAVVLQDCAQLESIQENTCTMILEDSDTPWPALELELGWLFLFLLQSRTANVTVNGCLFVCEWPPPALQPFETLTVTPSHGPQAHKLLGTPLMNASLVTTNDLGYPIHGDEVGTYPNVTTRQLPCVARRVLNTSQLMRAVVELQPISSQYVVIQLVRNISLEDQAQNGSSPWPHTNNALRVYRNLTITGRHALVTRTTELAFAQQSNIFWLDSNNASFIRFQQLTMSNMPCGPRQFFPASLFVLVVWPVCWNRTLGVIDPNRDLMEIKNSTMVQPEDGFNYLMYWVGIQTSPIPSVRALAAWQNTNIQGTLIVSNDSHTLFLARRWGGGISWTNTSFTDLQGVFPSKLQTCGLAQIMPGDPTFPYAYVTPVFTAQQFINYLANPKTQAVILLANITLADVLGPPGNRSLQAPHVLLNTNQTIKVLGWWTGDTVLDLGGLADVITLNITQGQQLSFQRLILSGLGPASPTQQPQGLANFTCMLWAITYPRAESPFLSLANVTMVVPSTELQQLAQFSGGSAAVAGLNATPAASANAAPGLGPRWAPRRLSALPNDSLGVGDNSLQPPANATVSWLQLQADWQSARVRSLNANGINISQSVWSGIDARDVLLTDVLPASVLASNYTPTPQNLALISPLTGQLNSQSSETSSGGGGLSGWQIAVLSIGCGLAALLAAGLLAWWVVKGRQHRQEDEAQKQRALEATMGAGQQRPGASSDGTSSVLITGRHPPLEVLIPSSSMGTPQAMTLPIIRTSGNGSSPSAAKMGSGNGSAGSSVRHLLQIGSHRTGSSGGIPVPGLSPGLAALTTAHEEDEELGAAPDEEIRRLVSQQRRRAAQPGTGARGGAATGDLDGVQLEEVLGQGSYGVVYKGRWRGMTVAVKTLTFHDAGPAARRARQRAVNEAAINTLLTHDCICNMYAYDLRPVTAGLPDDRLASHYRLYIIQEFCDCGSLAQAIDRGFFMDRAGQRLLVHLLHVACQISEGLSYIHSKNVIHGDLSSGNIMLKSDASSPVGFQAKLCDFGLSRFLEGPEQSHISNARQGTPFYLAPEVAAHGIISREADTFSLGVILWELYYAHCPPWRDPKVLAAAAARLQRGHDSRGMISPALLTAIVLESVATTAAGSAARARIEHAATDSRNPRAIAPNPATAAGAAAAAAPADAAVTTADAGVQADAGADLQVRLAEAGGDEADKRAPEDKGDTTQVAGEGGDGALVVGQVLGSHSTGTASTLATGMPQPLLLDPSNPAGFTYPLPPDCPRPYAELVAACLHPIPKVRPRLPDVVASLQRVLLDLQAQLGAPAPVVPPPRPVNPSPTPLEEVTPPVLRLVAHSSDDVGTSGQDSKNSDASGTLRGGATGSDGPPSSSATPSSELGTAARTAAARRAAMGSIAEGAAEGRSVSGLAMAGTGTPPPEVGVAALGAVQEVQEAHSAGALPRLQEAELSSRSAPQRGLGGVGVSAPRAGSPGAGFRGASAWRQQLPGASTGGLGMARAASDASVLLSAALAGVHRASSPGLPAVQQSDSAGRLPTTAAAPARPAPVAHAPDAAAAAAGADADADAAALGTNGTSQLDTGDSALRANSQIQMVPVMGGMRREGAEPAPPAGAGTGAMSTEGVSAGEIRTIELFNSIEIPSR